VKSKDSARAKPRNLWTERHDVVHDNCHECSRRSAPPRKKCRRQNYLRRRPVRPSRPGGR
jgi:hypothetical protein